MILFTVAIAACSKSDKPKGCSNPDLIDHEIICSMDINPVCGCDGETYTNACIAKYEHGITQYTEGACGCNYSVKGTVVRINGFSQDCPLMLLTSDGKYLEPVKLPTGVVLKENANVEFNYRLITTHKSLCVADGDLAEILCYRELASLGCQQQIKVNVQGMDDPVRIESAQVLGDCLEITFSYGGGCGTHDFDLGILQHFGPGIPIPHLQLKHHNNGDYCQALITQTLSFDLTLLRKAGTGSQQFLLQDNDPNASPVLYTYKY